ncbi:DNA polymerase III subunit beta [Mitsuaria sp. TWR114]|jgi:DNA polymerase-3 subunit beta|uniref:DNA polymerase III subunit beta n=1 Tax=unclassified Roseateles TaxID=2626991 RepID=UPI0008E7DC55|nr:MULTISPECIES: DNA polymerase III subunit beta [unclassified Roseateles]MBB3283879.1 DNA polymerase-3 subunit beta [Mitsuaria sp. BK037]MBB3295920.1 DNA polymerase-3 subunit beta [Mitsuaria sp. BK041]MBB3365135.1 DNA polymerase-3 subunit beta [Mitsuaria sp. BK045]TXD70499.1 DNA polymerase III subunit beta [Mitsuaria sp. TWR114]TXD83593.1 DNA polymerase III subunit beta [Mitsuaria sp. TWR114]
MIVLKDSQDKVLAALQAVSGIVERRHTLPILANVLVRKQGKQVELTTSDLEIQVRTTVEFEGDDGDFSTTIGARKLIDILRSMPSDQTVSLTSNQNKMTLQGGKSRFTLQTLPADDFPLVQEAADFGPAFSVPQKTLKGLINQVHFAMAVHDIRYYLNGILFVAEGKTLTLVATDGHRLALAQAETDTEMPKQEVILPRKTVLELMRLLKDGGKGDDESAPIEMRFAGNQAKFSFSGMEFVTKLVEGKFPDYNRVIPKNHRFHVILGRQPLLAALQRAAILTSEKFKAVRLSFEPGLLSIASSNAEQEEAKEELEIDYGGDQIETGFNVTYLMDVLANMSQDMVRVDLNDSSSSALLSIPEHTGFKYVVMPMRI